MLNAGINYEELYCMSHNKEQPCRKKDSVSNSGHSPRQFILLCWLAPEEFTVQSTGVRLSQNLGWRAASFKTEKKKEGTRCSVRVEAEDIPAGPCKRSPWGMLEGRWGGSKGWPLGGTTVGSDQGYVDESPHSTEEPSEAGNHKCVDRISPLLPLLPPPATILNWLQIPGAI